MSQEIISRTIGSVVDKRALIKNGQLKRLFSYLNDWTKIRIGIHFSFDGSLAANITGTPQFVFGLISDTDNGWGNVTTDHFLGWRTNVATWTYNAGAGNPYFSLASAAILTKKIGTTITSGSSFSPSPSFTANNTLIRNALFLEITKGSPNFTVQSSHPGSAAAAQQDITDDVFENMMNAVDISACSSTPTVAYSSSTAWTIAIDEATNGYFNGLNIFWDKTVGFEVSTVRHRKIS